MTAIATAAVTDRAVTPVISIDFDGEQIPVYLEILADDSVEMYDESEPHDMPTLLGTAQFDIFGTAVFNVDDSLGLAEAIQSAGLGEANEMHLDPMTGAPTRTIRLYASAFAA